MFLKRLDYSIMEEVVNAGDRSNAVVDESVLKAEWIINTLKEKGEVYR